MCGCGGLWVMHSVFIQPKQGVFVVFWLNKEGFNWQCYFVEKCR